MLLSHSEMEFWGKEFQRMRYALPQGTRFIDFLNLRERYQKIARRRLRDFADNRRVVLDDLEVHIN